MAASDDRTVKFESLLGIDQDVVEGFQGYTTANTTASQVLTGKLDNSSINTPAAAADTLTNPAAATAFATTITSADAAAEGDVYQITCMAECTARVAATEFVLEVFWGTESLGSVTLGAQPAANDYLYFKGTITVGAIHAANGVILNHYATVKDNGGVQAAVTAVVFDEGFDTAAAVVISAKATMANAAGGDRADLRQLTLRIQ